MRRRCSGLSGVEAEILHIGEQYACCHVLIRAEFNLTVSWDILGQLRLSILPYVSGTKPMRNVPEVQEMCEWEW
jgi:hypothetical protein